MAESSKNDATGEAVEALADSILVSPIASVVTDPHQPDNPIIEANAAFTALTGYSREEIIGRNCRFLAGEGTEPDAQQELREAIRGKRPVLVELTNYRKDGSPFRNAVMIAPLLAENGEVLLFLGSQLDVGPLDSLDGKRRARATELVDELSPRQRQVLQAMVRGLRNKQIAAELGIDEATVKMHRSAALSRLGAATSADAIRIGVEAGFAG